MGPKGLAASVEHSEPATLDVSAREVSRDGYAGRLASPADGSRARAGRESAQELDFDHVYEHYFDFVWRSLRLLGVAPELLEDVTQDVFSVVSRQFAEFEGRSSVRTWLFAILQRVAANQRRMQTRKLKPLEPISDALIAREPDAERHVEAAQAVHVIERFCASLDPGRRSVFVLALLEEVPGPEVAQALDIPINTVYSRVRSLRDGLRRALEQHEDGS